MDSFEALVALLLEREGLWVRSGVKVELTKEEKRRIKRPASPRWELDLVAYKATTNEVRIVECKSFLDSPGVNIGGFDGSRPQDISRYKLFHERVLLKTVVGRLVAQLEAAGACRASPKVVLCLAAGKIRSDRDRAALRAHFAKRGWHLYDDAWIIQRVRQMASSGYEDNVAAVVAKLIERAPKAA